MKKWILRLLGGKEEKKVAVLVDHLNIVLSDTAVFQRKILDYDVLREISLEFGKIIFAFTFIPEKFELPSFVHSKGFYPVLCPPKNGNEGKYKDGVDTIMTEVGFTLLEHSDIDALVIVANDGDYIRLANKAKFFGKKIHLVSGEKVSYLLKQIADTISPVPAS